MRRCACVPFGLGGFWEIKKTRRTKKKNKKKTRQQRSRDNNTRCTRTGTLIPKLKPVRDLGMLFLFMFCGCRKKRREWEGLLLVYSPLVPFHGICAAAAAPGILALGRSDASVALSLQWVLNPKVQRYWNDDDCGGGGDVFRQHQQLSALPLLLLLLLILPMPLSLVSTI